MKKIIITLTLFVAMVSFWSCEKETADIATGTVNYPVFVNSGNELNVVAIGENFSVPEVTVFDGSNDVTDQAEITGLDEVDLNTAGYYEINYSATTADGYTGTYSVKIFVYDPSYAEAPIAGNYKGSLSTIGGGPVTISEFNKGVYLIDDAFCGYYSTYRELGSVYVAKGYFIYIGNNQFILRNANSVWGLVEDLDGIDYDPATGVLTWVNINEGYTWNNLPFILTPVVE